MTEEFYCALLVCTCLAFILDGQKKDQINVCFEPDVAGGQPDWWGRRKNILVCWIVLQLVVTKKRLERTVHLLGLAWSCSWKSALWRRGNL